MKLIKGLSTKKLKNRKNTLLSLHDMHLWSLISLFMKIEKNKLVE